MAVDWESVRDEVVTHLQALLRINTVNPPGNEIEAAQYLATVTQNAGIAGELAGATPARQNYVARVRSNGAGRPVMLLGHMDVVGVEESQWSHPPFGGDIADGYVWGRGAVDMKGQVAANLVVMLLLQRSGIRLGRDVIMAATADEEAGSHLGARWLWQHRRDLVDAEYALNEGGGQLVDVNGQHLYTIEVGEKGKARMCITARAAPGHASIPLDDTAIYRLGQALVRLHAFQPPTIVTEPVARMLQVLGQAYGLEAAAVDALLEHPSWPALAALPLDADLRAHLRAATHNTAVPTILRGGHRINVIPSEVSVDVDGRVLPGQDPDAWVAQVQQAVGDTVEVTLLEGEPGIASDPASPFFDVIGQALDAADPGARLLPDLVTGGTDARAFPGMKVYGFMPTRDPATARLAHSHDERARIDDLVFATRCLYDCIVRFCAG
jgi:acetylornithine deacetylase/succinyl-diaminopimelate desuccinylase-like protein